MSPVLDISDEEYHADPGDQPTLSASIAKLLIQCPSKAWDAHPRLGGKPKPRTRAMDAGTLLDALLTTDGSQICAVERATKADGTIVEPLTNWQTKDAQKQRADLERNGYTVCLPHELDSAKEAAEALYRKSKALGFPIDGEFQKVLTWTETADDGTPVECRCKMDVFHENGLVQDIKRLAEVSSAGCRSAIRRFGYALQGSAYRSAVRANFPQLVGRDRFQLVCIEGDAPYPLTIVEHRGALETLGDQQWRRAINTWARLMRDKPNGDWPDYVDRVITIEPSQFDLEEEFSKGEAEYDTAI